MTRGRIICYVLLAIGLALVLIGTGALIASLIKKSPEPEKVVTAAVNAVNEVASQPANSIPKGVEPVDPISLPGAKIDYKFEVSLKDKPAEYINSNVYKPFKFVLPSDFLAEGDVKLTSIEGFYTDYNICGLQFTFNNGSKEFKTDLFGV
jgi:hypothetical protein